MAYMVSSLLSQTDRLYVVAAGGATTRVVVRITFDIIKNIRSSVAGVVYIYFGQFDMSSSLDERSYCLHTAGRQAKQTYTLVGSSVAAHSPNVLDAKVSL